MRGCINEQFLAVMEELHERIQRLEAGVDQPESAKLNDLSSSILKIIDDITNNSNKYLTKYVEKKDEYLHDQLFEKLEYKLIQYYQIKEHTNIELTRSTFTPAEMRRITGSIQNIKPLCQQFKRYWETNKDTSTPHTEVIRQAALLHEAFTHFHGPPAKQTAR
jgi:hypothetical protein